MAKHNDFGKLGEQQAKALLEQKGYTILDTNWVSGKMSWILWLRRMKC